MQFVITAHDGEGMLERRMAVRPRHLQNKGEIDGKVICAGGINKFLVKTHLLGPLIRVTGLIIAVVAMQMMITGIRTAFKL